jgi:hypothetical protein
MPLPAFILNLMPVYMLTSYGLKTWLPGSWGKKPAPNPTAFSGPREPGLDPGAKPDPVECSAYLLHGLASGAGSTAIGPLELNAGVCILPAAIAPGEPG